MATTQNPPTVGYRFVSKNLPVVVPQPNERPGFYAGPLLPEQVRVQIRNVLARTLGLGAYAEEGWRVVRSAYDYEMGTINLGQPGGIAAQVACGRFLAEHGYHEALDVIGLALLVAEWVGQYLDVGERSNWKIIMPARDAASEINRFLREANVPYQFEQGQWVHVESDYIHEEVIRPALDALDRPGFAGALQEFERALEHARNGKTKEAATEATKALESTIKCICTARGWTYPPNATAKPLFDVLVAQGFAESWMEGSFLGCANIRNKTAAAHGQGPMPMPMHSHRAQLAVNLAASVIVALLAALDANASC